MRVIATAGHVDHGKSTLVRCLTGMEPDRWAEERRRGLTIDLGYAWTSLPSGEQLAFVDVPGHQRFIANMLAGIGPAAAVLFVVAADEGWCAQSGEHLAAIDALQLRHGLLAVTRCDLADPEPARQAALEQLRASSLGQIESVALSPPTGAGIDELLAALGRLARQIPEPDPAAQVRLWIDRAFTVHGSGTVVTGTLNEGTLTVGDSLELRGAPVVVRGLQTLGAVRDRVSGPARVAVSLRGVGREQAARGDVLLAPPNGWHHTETVDVRLAAAGQMPAELVLHVGTAAVPVRLRALGGELARLTCARSLPLRTGDRGVLRDPGQQRIAAGVMVLDADPPQLRRRGAAAARAGELADADGRLDAIAEVTRRGTMSRELLAALGGTPPQGVRSFGDWLIAPRQWEQWVAAAPEAAAAWSRRSPVDPDMPLAALARELALPEAALASSLVSAAGLPVRNGRIIAQAEPSFGPAENAVRTVQQRLRSAPFDAPTAHDLAELGLTRQVLAAAERAERLLRVTEGVVLLPSAPHEAVRRLRDLPQPFTTSQARAALGTTRRVVVPLLEYLDAHGWTERDGDVRRVRGGDIDDGSGRG